MRAFGFSFQQNHSKNPGEPGFEIPETRPVRNLEIEEPNQEDLFGEIRFVFVIPEDTPFVVDHFNQYPKQATVQVCWDNGRKRLIFTTER